MPALDGGLDGSQVPLDWARPPPGIPAVPGKDPESGAWRGCVVSGPASASTSLTGRRRSTGSGSRSDSMGRVTCLPLMPRSGRSWTRDRSTPGWPRRDSAGSSAERSLQAKDHVRQSVLQRARDTRFWTLCSQAGQNIGPSSTFDHSHCAVLIPSLQSFRLHRHSPVQPAGRVLHIPAAHTARRVMRSLSGWRGAWSRYISGPGSEVYSSRTWATPTISSWLLPVFG